MTKQAHSRLVRNLSAFAVGLVTTMAAGLASAAIDTTAVTTAISDAGAAVAVVGAAVLVVIAGIKVYKWIRGAM